jgi:IMP dehydrogenase
MDGYSAKELFSTPTGYTYNDLILLPGSKPIYFGVDEVNLQTNLTPHIQLKVPFVSSPMDTVTESATAIAMALNGGIGIIHCNNSVEEQVREVERVKRYQNGFVVDPIVLSPSQTVGDIRRANYNIKTFPVTQSGEKDSPLIGCVTNRDIFFELDETRIGDIMITELVTAPSGTSLEEAQEIIKRGNIKFLPMIDQRGHLVSLVCRKDLLKKGHFPYATNNPQTGQLRVGAAISSRHPEQRVPQLIKAGVDVIVVDSSQGNSIYQHESIDYIKSKYSGQVEVIAGNIVTTDQVQSLIKCNPDGFRIGMGNASICTTQSVCGVGRPQAKAVYQVGEYLHQKGLKTQMPIIADGGISDSGHIIRALAMGADTVMMGSMFAGTEEAPGDSYYENGVRLKKYRGMGSLDAMKKRSAERYFGDQVKDSKNQINKPILIPQGVSGSVVAKGSIHQEIPRLVRAVNHGFQDLAHQSISELHGAIRNNTQRYEVRSQSAIREGGIHDLYSYQN